MKVHGNKSDPIFWKEGPGTETIQEVEQLHTTNICLYNDNIMMIIIIAAVMSFSPKSITHLSSQLKLAFL